MGQPSLSIKSRPSGSPEGRGLVVRLSYDEYIVIERQTRGTETSQYLEERTSTETPLVVASERGPGQWPTLRQQNRMESRAVAGDSPVCVSKMLVLE